MIEDFKNKLQQFGLSVVKEENMTYLLFNGKSIKRCEDESEAWDEAVKLFIKNSQNYYFSRNFSLQEFIYSPTAKIKGIDNIPTMQEVKHMIELCKTLLQPIRDRVGVIHITSGFRNPELNKAIGGSSKSDHMKGLAADHKPKNFTIEEYKNILLRDFYHLPFKQAIYYPDNSFFHISLGVISQPIREKLTFKDKSYYYGWLA